MQRCLGCMREFDEKFDVCPHCGYIVGSPPASKNHLAPGTMLQDRYRLGKALGQGGFGITYIAWDTKIDRAVAIKEYMPNAFASRMTGEKEISCYNEEAQLQFALGLEKTRKESHALSQFGALESVVKVHDCIEENGTAYIIMELLRGKTVKEILAARGRLTFAETMRIMTPVLQTLDAMHGVGMIHRDVAPDNIFVCDDGKIKLLDFGAARVISGTDEKTLSVTLKAGYAPAEQYSGSTKQGPYTDVYAASATIYKMLTGETPPDGLSRTMRSGDLTALTKSDAPQSAQETILHGMAPAASERIQRAKDLLDALQKDAPENIGGIDPKQFLQEQKKKQTKKAAGLVLAALLLVCLAAVVVFCVRFFRPEIVAEEEGAMLPAAETLSDLTQTELTTELLSATEGTTESATNGAQWIAAYKSYLLNRVRQIIAEADDPDEYEDYSPLLFSLIYLDNDDIPELVVSEAGFHFGTATLIIFYDGNLVSFSNLGYYGAFQYKERQGIIVESDTHSGASGATVWKYAKGTLTCVWNGLEIYPYLMVEDGGEAEYYFRDPDAVDEFRRTAYESDSAYEKLQATERKVSEAEYNAAYSANVPTGLVNSIGDCSVSMTKKNVQKYFAALADRSSVPIIRYYAHINLSGTVSDKQTDYNDNAYYLFELDEPTIVQFTDDAFPALLTSIRFDGYEESDLPSGHASITVSLEKDENGDVVADIV